MLTFVCAKSIAAVNDDCKPYSFWSLLVNSSLSSATTFSWKIIAKMPTVSSSENTRSRKSKY